ncbi:MAG: Histidine--tRNA ligase [Parcubacteria group bacterium]|nr:Histidine--tRNA ligase [Parcubacteria group bacterium]
MEKQMNIQPRLAAGIRDYLPEDMIPRQKMLDAIRRTFELYGFVPLDTPGLELEEVLTGGDPAFNKQIFRAGLGDLEDADLALRFDLTVPLARVIAQYGSQLEKPFKRYQMGKVWRGEKPQAGRFREFVQFDADIVGSSRPESDAEIIALMGATMEALGFENYLVRVNNRKILNGLASFIGFDASKSPDVLRIIDKMDKIEWAGVKAELEKELGFGTKEFDALRKFLDLMEGEQEGLLEKVRALMSNSPIALEGVAELEEISKSVIALGVPREKWVIDLSVARGLGYYTGPVFETILTDLPSIGSVFGGGRYDDLVERFMASSIPAVGASVGVDRIFAAMEKLGIVKKEKTVSKVLVLNFDPDCSAVGQSVLSSLRRAGVPSEIYLGRELTFKAQLAYAVKQEFPVVIIIGSREKEAGVVQVKDMNARKQDSVAFSDVPDAVKRIVDL